MTFGSKDNYHTENIIFDVADIALPYNGIIGRPALAKFMVVIHHAYHALKLPSLWGTLTVKTDTRDAVLCGEQMFKAAATVSLLLIRFGPNSHPDSQLAREEAATLPGTWFR